MRLLKMIGGLIVLLALLGIYTSNHDRAGLNGDGVAAQPQPPDVPAVAAAKADLRDFVMLARALRDNMKNPASFQLEHALRMAPGTLCITYRGTNSFNAVVPGYAVIANLKIATSDQGGDFQSMWDKHCKGKRGGDYADEIREAL